MIQMDGSHERYVQSLMNPSSWYDRLLWSRSNAHVFPRHSTTVPGQCTTANNNINNKTINNNRIARGSQEQLLQKQRRIFDNCLLKPDFVKEKLTIDDKSWAVKWNGGGGCTKGAAFSMNAFQKSSFRWLLPRVPQLQRRLVHKSGECNITSVNIDKRGRRFLADIFTTLVDIKWRWNLLIFALAFTISWVFFAFLWWLICYAHGDVENHQNPDWKPCVQNVHDFPTAFLFSIETQQTIGYGYRCTSSECPVAIIVMMLQSCFGIIIQALMTGLVFAKISRPKKRAQTLMFSKNALICQRDDELCLLFRVGDMRKSHIVEAQVRAIFVSKRVTREGEVLALYQRDLKLGQDDAEGRIFLVWPIIVEHRITPDSPLWDVSAEDLNRKHFEILVILEGIVESTGMTTQARTSYLPSEILWGHRFERLVSYQRDNGQYLIDYSSFNRSASVEISPASAKDRAAETASRKRKDSDTSSDNDTPNPLAVAAAFAVTVDAGSSSGETDEKYERPTKMSRISEGCPPRTNEGTGVASVSLDLENEVKSIEVRSICESTNTKFNVDHGELDQFY